MAKVYASPLEAPPLSWDSRESYAASCAEYTERLADWCRNTYNGKGDLVGEVVRFQIADGYAEYMVANHSPLTLINLGLGDGYSIPEAHARGLRLTDIRKDVERERRIRAMFAEKRNAEA